MAKKTDTPVKKTPAKGGYKALPVVAGRMSSTEPNLKEKEPAPGFYVLLTGPKRDPIQKDFLVGVHGQGPGRLLRGAKWALHKIAVEKTPSAQLRRDELLPYLYEKGYRKFEVLERTPKREAKKTGVQHELKEFVSLEWEKFETAMIGEK